MTRLFWELYLPTLAILFGLGLLTATASRAVERAWRRWRCRREMEKQERLRLSKLPRQDLQREYNHAISQRVEAIGLLKKPAWTRRRQELDGLATARDKAERKIH